MKSSLVVIRAAVLLLAVQGASNAATVYINDFETAIGPGLVLTSGGGVLGLDADSSPASKFLGLDDSIANGGLGNNEVTLSLTGLPTHSTVTVSFDAYIMRSMDGGFTCCGPDEFVFQLGSFTRTTTFGGDTQTFPNFFETGGSPTDNAPYTGGTFTGSAQGAFFPVSFTLPHTDSNVVMTWSMSGLQGVADEGWGLDNIRVAAIPEPEMYVFLLTGLGLVGWFSRHRRFSKQ